STDVLVSALLGQALSVCGNGGALLAQIGAGVACRGAAKAMASITELIPHITSGVVQTASPTVLLAPGLGAALAAATPMECLVHHDNPIVPTAPTVLVQGMALARVGGTTGCGAILCDGVPAVLAGGPAASGAGAGT